MSEDKKEGKLSKFLRLFESKKSSCCSIKIEEVDDGKEKADKDKNNKCCS